MKTMTPITNKEAAIAWGQGKEIFFRAKENHAWKPMTNVVAFKDNYYFALPVELDYSKDQGFKKGDFVLFSDDGEDWIMKEYVSFSPSRLLKHRSAVAFWRFAKPLPQWMKSKVKWEGE